MKWTQGKPGGGELLFFSFFLIFLLRTFTNILFLFFFLENSFLDLSRRNGRKVSQGEGNMLVFLIFLLRTFTNVLFLFFFREQLPRFFKMKWTQGKLGGISFFLISLLRMFTDILFLFFFVEMASWI